MNLDGDVRYVVAPLDEGVGDCLLESPSPDGGILSFRDPDAGEWVFEAPAKFLGNQSAMFGGTIQWLQHHKGCLVGDPPEPSFRVILVSSNRAIVKVMPPPAENRWVQLSVRLDALEGWLWADDTTGQEDLPPATATQIQEVLQSLTGFRILGEFITGDDLGSLDTVVFSRPAEPEFAPPIYHAVFLSTLWATGAFPAAINNSNQITGVRNGRAFLYSYGTGEMTDIGTFGGQYGRLSDGVALNDSGQVAGRAPMDLPNFAERAFLYQDGAMINLGSAPGSLSTSRAWGINNAGQVVGGNLDPVVPFLYNDGVLTSLTPPDLSQGEAYDINNAGQIVGWASWKSKPNDPVHAFLYAGGTMQDIGTLDGRSEARAINDSGQVVGWSALPSLGTQMVVHPFLYSQGVMTDLGTLGGPIGQAHAINKSGQVVGESFTATGGEHAFLYSDGTMDDLNDLLANELGRVGDELRSAISINDSGVILASGTAGHYLLMPVPTLAISLAAGSGIQISWPASLAGFVLEENDNLAMPNWIQVSQEPIQASRKWQVTISTSGRRFYRLRGR